MPRLASPRRLAAVVLDSPSIKGAMIFAFSGAAFALGNLLLAKGLSTDDYGKLALVIAILVVTSSVAPLGLDQLLLRQEIRLTGRYLKPILATAGAIALAAAIGGRLIYGLTITEAAVLALATIVMASLRTISAALRRHGRRTVATFSDTATDWIILITGIVVAMALIRSGSSAALFFGLGTVLATLSAAQLLRRIERDMPRATAAVDRLEVGSLLGIAAAGAVLVQAERLLIPLLLSLHDLAVFAVLTSVAIAPFRVLASGIVTSLAQQMRLAENARARRRALVTEGMIFAVLTAAACVVVIFVGPWVALVLTAGKYHVTLALAGAACVNGIGKVLQSIFRAIIIGAGSSRDLHQANMSIWLCVLGTVLGSLASYRAGLSGFILGAAIGNIVATTPLLRIARRLLDPAAPVAA